MGRGRSKAGSGGRRINYTSPDKTTFKGEELSALREYTVYSSRGFTFKGGNPILEAKSDGKGTLTIDSAKGEESEGKYPQRGDEGYYKYSTTQGFKVNSDHSVQSTGINWDNVKEIKGSTFDIKEEIKSHGFKWDGTKKSWVKK